MGIQYITTNNRFFSVFGASVIVAAIFLGMVFLAPIFASATVFDGDPPLEITAKALLDHDCDSSEWHFVITDIQHDSLAPDSIVVSWDNTEVEEVFLDTISGKVAHYRTSSFLDATVTEANTTIYGYWKGQFNLSHGPCPDPEPEDTTIVAHKIVCSKEALLPNWGAGGADITIDTAEDFVLNSNGGCWFEEGWSFEWAKPGTPNPGDDFYGAAGGDWTSFGPTDSGGEATLVLEHQTIKDISFVWMREVLKEGFVPFTFGLNGNTNVDDVSAEIYCHSDVLNYDNYDRVDNLEAGSTFYCVAFNTEIPDPEPTLGSITVCKVALDAEGNIIDGNGDNVTFEVSGLDFNNPAGVLPTSEFITPLTLNTDLFGGDHVNDAMCVLYDELGLGSYYYDEEVIIGNTESWETPLYNDQNVVPVSELEDFFPYSGELFDQDALNDENRNTNSDGHIVLTKGRPDRTLVVHNQLKDTVEEGCECKKGIVLLTVRYLGESDGKTINVYANKDHKDLITTFNDVDTNDILTIDASGFGDKGKLSNSTYLEVVGEEDVKIHTSCSKDIIGVTFGDFVVVAHTDTESNMCGVIENNPFEIVATKIVCESESDLPNWGDGSGPETITALTAQEYVHEHPSCYLEEGWKFEWALGGVSNPGDNGIGLTGGDWNFFGPSNSQGVATVQLEETDLDDSGRIWVREVMKDAYQTFSGVGGSNVSAEMYCHDDVLNYDNYDFIQNPLAGEEYYCVAFNVLEEEPDICSIEGHKYNWNTEEGLPNWTIGVANVGEVQTDENGAYCFMNLDPGTYTVYEELQYGWYPVTVLVDGLPESHSSDSFFDVFVEIEVTTGETTVVDFWNKEKHDPKPKAECEDGIDNDNDHLVDIFDPGCHTDGDAQNPLSYNPDDDDEFNEIPYAPYCGDNAINQVWEQCDGTDTEAGRQCTEQCQFVDNNQCTDLVLARVNTSSFENHSNGDVTSDIFLGSALNRIPGSAWFALHFNENYSIDPNISAYEDVPGLAVQRLLGQVRVLLHGSHPHDGSKEHINGNVEFWNTTITSQSNDTSGNNKLEGEDPNDISSMGSMDNVPGDDEIWLEDGNDIKSFFWMTVTTADDAFFTQYADAPMCPIILPQCSDGIDNDGDGRIDHDGAIDGDAVYLPDLGCTGPEDDDENERPLITLRGDNPLILIIGAIFSEPSADVDDPEDGDIDHKLVIGGDLVDTSATGTFKITYNATDTADSAALEVTRDVVVLEPDTPLTQCTDGEDNDGDERIDSEDAGCHIDDNPDNPYDPTDDDENQKPVITLVGSSTVIVNLNDTFTDDEATVADPEDGDITSKLVIAGDVVDTSATGTYTITYNATDTQNKAADEVTRNVFVVDSGEPTECSDQEDNDGDERIDSEDAGCHTDQDPDNPESYDPTDDSENEKPVISRIGSATVSVTRGTTYADQGATAHDPEDGVLSVSVGGDTVNINALGTYVITYDAVDSDGEEADQVTRTVTVVPAPITPTCVTNCGGGGGGGGPFPNNLRIFNEQISVVSEGTALVTWQTNKPATSRVLYDTTSQIVDTGNINTGTGSETLGYTFTTETDQELVLNHSMLINNVNLQSLFFFRPISKDTTRAIGRELSTSLGTVTQTSCGQYLFEFIRFGSNNTAGEVVKLQRFLNDFEGERLVVNGSYDRATFDAVVRFQRKYAGDVLSPWGLEQDTGYVYLTTRKKINELHCNNQLPFPLSDDQLAEVNSFRALLASLRSQGQPLPNVSNVGLGDTAPTTGIAGSGGGGIEGGTVAGGGGTGEPTEQDDSLAAAISATAQPETEGVVTRMINRIGTFIRGVFGKKEDNSTENPGVRVEVRVDE